MMEEIWGDTYTDEIDWFAQIIWVMKQIWNDFFAGSYFS